MPLASRPTMISRRRASSPVVASRRAACSCAARRSMKPAAASAIRLAPPATYPRPRRVDAALGRGHPRRALAVHRHRQLDAEGCCRLPSKRVGPPPFGRCVVVVDGRIGQGRRADSLGLRDGHRLQLGGVARTAVLHQAHDGCEVDRVRRTGGVMRRGGQGAPRRLPSPTRSLCRFTRPPPPG